jgi:uncharacterized membrane protein
MSLLHLLPPYVPHMPSCVVLSICMTVGQHLITHALILVLKSMCRLIVLIMCLFSSQHYMIVMEISTVEVEHHEKINVCRLICEAKDEELTKNKSYYN